jgi:type I restriction enzyme S subunit
MPANDLLSLPWARSGPKTQLVNASLVAAAEYRLDAPAFLARQNAAGLLKFSGEGQMVSDLAEVFTVYIQSPILAYVKPFSHSRPYMTTSELAEYHTGRLTHVSLVADPRLIGWEIKEGNIIVSRSGRVGEAYWVDKNLNGVLVGDSFRVVPKNADDRFFLYALLASSMAHDFLSGSAYGSVVDHASVDQLRRFPIPAIGAKVKERVSERVGRAIQSRDDAYDLLDDAQKSFRSSNGLPSLTAPPECEPDESPGDHDFVSSGDVLDSIEGASEFRLEAHFHNPRARSAIKTILACSSSKKSVRDVTHDVILPSRFRRNYVESSYGTPFLSGKNVVQIRPTDLKYLSTSQTEDLDESLLKRGWVLVTRSGTIGRTCFVWQNFEDYAASEHLLRVIPNEDQADAGYLYAFLSSDYGYEQILRFRYGSVIDEVTDEQLKKVIIPLPSPAQQRNIGDKVRQAYQKRAEALRLEDEAQEILMREIKGKVTEETLHV